MERARHLTAARDLAAAVIPPLHRGPAEPLLRRERRLARDPIDDARRALRKRELGAIHLRPTPASGWASASSRALVSSRASSPPARPPGRPSPAANWRSARPADRVRAARHSASPSGRLRLIPPRRIRIGNQDAEIGGGPLPDLLAVVAEADPIELARRRPDRRFVVDHAVVVTKREPLRIEAQFAIFVELVDRIACVIADQ